MVILCVVLPSRAGCQNCGHHSRHRSPVLVHPRAFFAASVAIAEGVGGVVGGGKEGGGLGDTTWPLSVGTQDFLRMVNLP